MASFRGSVSNLNKEFEEQQTSSVLKAIAKEEKPTKIKHVRTIIMGSFHEQGCGTFWSAVTQLPLKTNMIMCWKFCHVLHKLILDGHPNVLRDSLTYISLLDDLGRSWGQRFDSYGMLASHYCKLLSQRLTFHKKHPKLPGNLRITDEGISESTSNDANGYFEFSVELLDLMDELLNLQTAVFKSLDNYRGSSSTQSEQCRLYPLILSIQDTCHLYNRLVNLLFTMHCDLSPSMLDGHRERFNNQFNRLRQFYQTCANQQYYRTLVQVPSLPDSPPNFLVASDLARHCNPVAVVREDDADSYDKAMTPTAARPVEASPMQTPLTPPTTVHPTSTKAQERELQTTIADLTSQLEAANMSAELRKMESVEMKKKLDANVQECTQLRTQLEAANMSAEQSKMENAATKTNLDANVQECTQLRAQLEAVKGRDDATSRLAKAESAAKQSEEKLKKMNDVYGQLREEHIALLRTHAELRKQSEADKITAAKVSEALQRTAQELEQLHREKAAINEALQSSSDRSTVEAAELQQRLTDAEQLRERFAEQLKAATKEAADSRSAASKAETERSAIATLLQEVQSRQQGATEAAALLKQQLGATRDEAQKSGAELERTAKELERLQRDKESLQITSDRATLKVVALKQQLNDAEERYQRTTQQLEQLQCDNKTLQASSNDATSEVAELKQQLNDVKQQHQDLTTKFEAARKEAAEWKSVAEHTMEKPLLLVEDTLLGTQPQDSLVAQSVTDCASSI